MTEFVCPKCRAEIPPDLIETTGAAVCPFCAANLSKLGLPQPSTSDSDSYDAATSFSEADSGPIARSFPPLPAKSRVKIAEASDDRLVLLLAGGGKSATGLGCFALMWNLFMCVFTPPWFLGAFQGGGNNGPRELATSDIDSVQVETMVKTAQNPRVRGANPASGAGSPNCCIARAGSKSLSLTMFQEERAARLVASLIRTRFEKMGHLLRDA